MSWEIEFYEDDRGRQPAREWLSSLDKPKRDAAIAAIECYLAEFGLDICGTEHGKALGKGLFEFRIRHDEGVIRRKAGEAGAKRGSQVLLRIFCHAYGQRIVLLLGGYDKGEDPAPRRQAREIETARQRLRSFALRQKRRQAGSRRRA